MRALGVLIFCVALVGCDSSSGGGAIPSSGGPLADAAVDGAVQPAQPCPGLNLTETCTCGDTPGFRACQAEGWGACQCLGVDADGGTDGGPLGGNGANTPAGNLRSDLGFDWERTPASGGSCEPGFYVGTFEGVYFSSALFGLVPVPVVSLGTLERPGLAFTLEQSSGGEKLEITEGWMEGTANAAFPFEATITGGLDCSTREFVAEMDGGYWIDPFMGGERVNFRGPIVGTYDKITHTIQMGTWNLDEYDPEPPIPAGGEGTWQAGWQP